MEDVRMRERKRSYSKGYYPVDNNYSPWIRMKSDYGLLNDNGFRGLPKQGPLLVLLFVTMCRGKAVV